MDWDQCNCSEAIELSLWKQCQINLNDDFNVLWNLMFIVGFVGFCLICW